MTITLTRRPGRKRKAIPVTLANWEGPTPERIRHVEFSGSMLVVDVYQTDKGEQTQLKRMRIVSPLEMLWKVGTLDSGQYGAARRYQGDADKAAVAGPNATVRYEPRMIEDGGKRFLLPIEAATDHLMKMARAQQACGERYRRMLDWVATEPLGAREQARLWWPKASERWSRAEFIRELRVVCDRLEGHYRRKA